MPDAFERIVKSMALPCIERVSRRPLMDYTRKTQDERSYGTNEERHVLALEIIADELVLICQQLERLGDHLCGTEKARNAPEGASPDVSHEIPAGITRSVTEQFQVGPYKYTKLADAKAALRRTSEASEKEVRRLTSRRLD